MGDVDVDIGANASAEGGGDDEGVDAASRRVVDIVDTCRLVVRIELLYATLGSKDFFSQLQVALFRSLTNMFWILQEQPTYDKKGFLIYFKVRRGLAHLVGSKTIIIL